MGREIGAQDAVEKAVESYYSKVQSHYDRQPEFREANASKMAEHASY